MTHCSRDTECDVYVVHDNSGDYDSLMGRATTSVAADDDVYNQPCTTLDTPANMTAGDDDGNSNNNNNDVVVHGKQRSRYAGLLIRSDSSSDSDDDDKNSSSDDNPSSHDASGGSAAARRTQSPPARVPVQRNTPTAQQRTSAAVTAAPPVTGTAAVPTAAARTVATRSALTSTTPAAAQAAAAAAAVTKTTTVIAERASNRSSSSTGDEAHSDTNRVPQQEHRQQQEEEESEKKVAAAVGATTTTTPSRKSDAAMETDDDTVASGSSSSSNNKEEEDNNKPVACAHNADNVGDSAEDEDDVCCICLEPYTDENPMYRGACQHQFHVPCLLAWKNRCNTCPLCNMDTLRGVGDSEVARPVVSRPDTSADAALARQLQEHYRRQARRVRRASREALHAHAAAVATATATATSTTATTNNIATTRQQQHAALPLSQHTQQDGVAVERGPSTATLQLQETAVPMYGPLPHTSRNTKAQRVAAVGNRRNSQTHAHALRVAAIAAERAQRRVDEDSSHKSSCSVM